MTFNVGDIVEYQRVYAGTAALNGCKAVVINSGNGNLMDILWIDGPRKDHKENRYVVNFQPTLVDVGDLDDDI